MKAEVLSFADADKRAKKALSRMFQGGYERVLFVDGDLAINGDLLDKLSTKQPFDVIAVTGNLTVAGRIRLYENTPGCGSAARPRRRLSKAATARSISAMARSSTSSTATTTMARSTPARSRRRG